MRVTLNVRGITQRGGWIREEVGRCLLDESSVWEGNRVVDEEGV